MRVSRCKWYWKNHTFKKYPWAYFGLVNKENNQYVETLQIDSSENKKDLFMYSKPAIIKKIGLIGSEGSDGAHVKVFSEEEQFELFVQAYDDFSGAMDFTNLINCKINFFFTLFAKNIFAHIVSITQNIF